MDILAPLYAQMPQANSAAYRHERRLFVDWMTALLRRSGCDPAGMRFLDVGCGTGEILELLSECGARDLTGLDLAEGMLAETRRRLGDRARLVEGALEDPVLDAERFDAVVAAFTVHHLHDPSAFFSLADRVLAPGGWLFVLEFDAASRAYGRWLRPVLRGLTWPLRASVKHKNRERLGRLPDPPKLFNPAHRLLRADELAAAHRSREQYDCHRRGHGFLLPFFNYAFVEGSAVDGALVRTLEALDTLAAPLGGGVFQWLGARRR